MVSGKCPGSFRYIFLLSAGWKLVLAWKYPSLPQGHCMGLRARRVVSPMSVVSRVDGGLRQMAWLWRDAMRWLLCPRCVRRPVLATCALALSRSRTWLCCTRCCS